MRILLGVTGSIAAYKACSLVREFVKLGDTVRVVMTSAATQFVTPLTFQTLSQNRVGLDLFDPTFESEIGHIETARWADVLVIAPATANTIAKLVHGLADDLLSTIAMATTAPVVVAPAMNSVMWNSDAVQQNITILKQRGIIVVEPDSGKLACKETGPGRLPDPPVLIEAVAAAVTRNSLENRTILITAGPTREWIDAARFLSNPSSGKMGFALAQAAANRGAKVILIKGPTSAPLPHSTLIKRIDIESAHEMHDAVFRFADKVDAVIMAAAVADLHPEVRGHETDCRPSTKIAKSTLLESIHFSQNPDILQQLGDRYPIGKLPLIIGFAAQSHNIEQMAEEKRIRKAAAIMIANKIGGTDNAFGNDKSTVSVVVDPAFEPIPTLTRLELASKKAHAEKILDIIEEALQQIKPTAEIVAIDKKARKLSNLHNSDETNFDRGPDE